MTDVTRYVKGRFLPEGLVTHRNCRRVLRTIEFHAAAGKNAQGHGISKLRLALKSKFSIFRPSSETGFLNKFRPSRLQFQATLPESESSDRSLTVLLRLSPFPYHTTCSTPLSDERGGGVRSALLLLTAWFL